MMPRVFTIVSIVMIAAHLICSGWCFGAENFSISGHSAFLMLPENPNSDTPWVWYAPTFQNLLPGPEENWMITQFLAQGIAVAGIDIGESYGSPDGRALFSSFYHELVQNRGMSQKTVMLARSRGGLMLYNWAAEHPTSVAAIAGIYPVVDLRSYPGLATACGAYHMTQSQLEADLANHNPIDRLAPLAAANVPIYHIHGDSDTIVPLEQNSAELARRYAALGGQMTLDIKQGRGHAMWEGWFQDQGLTNFVITQALAIPEPCTSLLLSLGLLPAIIRKK